MRRLAAVLILTVVAFAQNPAGVGVSGGSSAPTGAAGGVDTAAGSTYPSSLAIQSASGSSLWGAGRLQNLLDYSEDLCSWTTQSNVSCNYDTVVGPDGIDNSDYGGGLDPESTVANGYAEDAYATGVALTGRTFKTAFWCKDPAGGSKTARVMILSNTPTTAVSTTVSCGATWSYSGTIGGTFGTDAGQTVKLRIYPVDGGTGKINVWALRLVETTGSSIPYISTDATPSSSVKGGGGWFERLQVGNGSRAAGKWSTAGGHRSLASGSSSVAFGEDVIASSASAAAFGSANIASGADSFVSGHSNTSSGFFAFAAGDHNTASGYSSVTAGEFNIAAGRDSVALGLGNRLRTGGVLLGSGNRHLGGGIGSGIGLGFGLVTSGGAGSPQGPDCGSSMALGGGNSTGEPLVNWFCDSLVIGQNTIVPLFSASRSSRARFARDYNKESAGVGKVAFGDMVARFGETLPPTTAVSLALAGAGAGNVDNGYHAIAVKFNDAVGDTLLGPAAQIQVTDATSNGQVSVTNIPLGPTGTTTRKLYATKAVNGSVADSLAGGPWFLLTTISDNTTTTYTYNTADASLGALLTFDENTQTPGFQISELGAAVSGGTPPTVSGCTSAAIVAGSALLAGQVNTTPTGACALTLTFPTAAAHGWNCAISNQTTANLIRQTASTATTAVFTGITVVDDVLAYGPCIGW